jgi:hypothetical protein
LVVVLRDHLYKPISGVDDGPECITGGDVEVARGNELLARIYDVLAALGQ